MHFDLARHTIFKTMTGSHAYGVATPESDVDWRGVCIPPRELVLSAFKQFEQHESHEPDEVVYSIFKFVRLAAEANPSILELFYIEPDYWDHHTSWWDELRSHRDLFLSTRVVHSFGGYANAQLHRMQTHVRWMAKAPKEPKPEDFGLSHGLCLGKDEVGAYDWLVAGEYVRFGKEIIQLMSRVKGYQQALKEWKNYQEWVANRNPKRAALERAFGMDTKHAYHLVRLARLGEELLATGKMTVCNRPDREELAAIRNGAWSYEQILTFAQGIDARLDALKAQTVLPREPAREAIDRLLVDLVDRYWCWEA